MDITQLFWTQLDTCHIKLSKQAIQHKSSDHGCLIQNDNKFSCKHSCFFSKILLMNNAIDQVKKNVKIEWNQLQVELQHLQKVL